MKNIHLIPTDKPSRLGYLTKKGKEVFNDLRLFEKPMPNILDSENQHIYITSDEEIKDCWCLNTHTNDVYFLKGFYGIQPITKKIIITTDQDLIKDHVQAIDDGFLEWFVKNPSCEEVEVQEMKCTGQCWKFIESDYEDTCTSGCELKGKYKIIIPKEEPNPFELPKALPDDVFYESLEPKQETRKNRLLEELIDKIKNQQSFLMSVKKNPQLYYYKLGNCIYERLYNNNNCFEMQDPYGGRSSKMEQELIKLKAEKIYYE